MKPTNLVAHDITVDGLIRCLHECWDHQILTFAQLFRTGYGQYGTVGYCADLPDPGEMYHLSIRSFS